MQKKSMLKSKKSKKSNHINETRQYNPVHNPFSFGNFPGKTLSTSKILTKETDAFCELSISYTNDFPEPHCTDAILSNARSSLIDLRSEAQMYLDSSKRATMKRNRESVLSCSDSIQRHSATTQEHMNQLMASIHESMKEIKEKLENVDEKQIKRDEESRIMRESIFELKDKIEELRENSKGRPGCSKMCVTI